MKDIFKGEIIEPFTKKIKLLFIQKIQISSVILFLVITGLSFLNDTYWDEYLSRKILMNLIIFIGVCLIISTIITLFSSKPLNGKKNGNIEISKEYIIIQNTKIDIKQITELNIINNDHKEKVNFNRYSPSYSNGSMNFINFKTKELNLTKKFIINDLTDFNKLERIKTEMISLIEKYSDNKPKANNAHKK